MRRLIRADLTIGVGLALLGIEGAAYIIRAVLFGIVIWRQERLPRWTGVLFALGVLLLAVPVTLATELPGAVGLSISAIVIAWKGWQESRMSPHEAPNPGRRSEGSDGGRVARPGPFN